MLLNFDKLLEGSKTRIVDSMYIVEPNHEHEHEHEHARHGATLGRGVKEGSIS